MDQNPNEEPIEAQEHEEEGGINIRYKKGRDTPSDIRNVILTVAILLAVVTYQAVFNLSGSIWQENVLNTGRLAPSPPLRKKPRLSNKLLGYLSWPLKIFYNFVFL
ncbi:hypothetical protein K1719_002797 [Acacia pycnantha]|nr:hypothetical protein K1719_002797 [Acacia pycnantha]